MKQTLSHDEILDRLNEIIEGHAAGDRFYGYIGQDPYKSDIFRLFVSAFDQDLDIAKADALCDHLAERFPAHYEQTKMKNDVLVTVVGWWGEWRYALTRYHASV
ncbi:MAG: hypothetical protein V3T84_13535 [Phycisphaerales bacterium]